MDVTPEEVDDALNAAPIPQQREPEIEDDEDYEDSYQDQQYQQPPQTQHTSPPQQQPQQQQQQRVAYSPPAQVSRTKIDDLRCWFG